ncbi:hypothetical protein IMZ48_17675 [Candidatus Bathyarchaeota archaeon]|nr:hypothetical protein [Candidatus Bathyarchaeota archaeon]
MAPTASVDASGDRAPKNGTSRKAPKKERATNEPPKQATPGPGSPTPDATEGLEEFDKSLDRLDEQRVELERNLFGGLVAQKTLEQRYAELQVLNKKREDELSVARAEVETMKGTLAKREQEAATCEAELAKSNEMIRKLDAEKKDLTSNVSELEGQVKQKIELVDQEAEKARKAVEEKDEALRAAEKRVQRILAYAQTKVGEVVDKNQELLKRLHGAL